MAKFFHLALARKLWRVALRDGWMASVVACFVMGATLLAVVAVLLGPDQ